MDFMKLISLSIALFMGLEIIKVKLAKTSKKKTRVISFIVIVLASVGLGYVAPVIVTKAVLLVNSILYFITEYFIYLFVKEELKVNIKDYILKKIRGN